MKKRLRGLLALWLALVMAVFLPVTTYAATTDDVYFYTGKATLQNNDKPSTEELVQVSGTEAFQVDTSLYTQYSSRIPEGYNVTGWKLWKADSGFNVSSAYDMALDGTISQEEFDSQFTSADNVVLEPLLELKYKISHQPTNAEPYVLINEENVVSTYEWYSVQTEEYAVEDNVIIEDKIGSYDSDSGTWSGVVFDDTGYSLSLSVGQLTVGDTLQITPIENNDIEITVSWGDFSLSKNGDGVWSGTISSNDYFGLNITSTSAFSVVIKGIQEDIASVDGQSASVFSGSNGTYFCKVTLTNEASLNSDRFTYFRYDINSNESSNGSYELQVDGEAVTKAALGDTITIVPSPDAGYELDTITVTKTNDDYYTEVTVTNNTFTMPDYPVTVDVTFKKKTYAVTLPQGQMAYTVTSEQTSPVEHGDSYTFTVTINNGYAASENFTVKANDIALFTETDVNGIVYKCIINNVTEAQEITVTGVLDVTAPVVTITLDENNLWQNFLNQITFELFFKDEKSLTIDATDAESGIRSVEYYLTDTDLFPEDKTYTAEEIESAIPAWKAYTEKISLSEDKQYVLYAKVTDKDGNVSYASTTGIVVDTMPPVISGIKDGGIYYGDTSFTLSDDYLKTVTVDDGEPVTVDSSPYTDKITADNGMHTVTAADQAGNSVSYSISVYKTYTVTLLEGTGYKIESSQASQVNYGSDFSFTVKLEDGYSAPAGLEVKEGSNVLTGEQESETVYTYTIAEVMEDKTVTVSGIVPVITKSGATGGNYTVTIDNKEVTAAAKDTVVSITPTPADGYEVDKITVTKTGDSNTEVTVTNNSFAMPDYPVTVDVTFKKKTYAVTLPQGQMAYTVTSEQASPVEHGDSYTFTVTINNGYAASENFSVNANNTALTATSVNGKVYTYTIQNVTTAQEITVTGILDVIAPVVTITLDEKNLWQSFLNQITFELFFKDEKSLTIDATDAESGIQSVEYYLTDTDLFPEDKTYTAEEIESAIPAWKAYTEEISLSEDKQYVLYAKVTDQDGNVSYASTTGIVIDTLIPEISGIENGGTYYGDIFVTISDDNLDKVTVDGKTLELTDTTNTIIITADSDTHTIQAADQAGNQISYQVRVYETWVRDGISSGGVYHLKPGIPYKLGSGKWKVAGDDTVYEGGNTFYVQESGTFEFQKQ